MALGYAVGYPIASASVHSRCGLLPRAHGIALFTRGETQVQLLIYFMLKYAMEILLSESSVVTTYYFGWSTSAVAIFLACIGLTVLLVNILVGSYISNMFEDRWSFHFFHSNLITHKGPSFQSYRESPYSAQHNW